MNNYFNTAKSFFSGVAGIAFIRILWVFVHWSVSRIYPYFCAPEGLFGLFLSPFVSQAPHCIAMFWLIEISRRCIKDMWLVIGTFVVYKVSALMSFNTETTEPSPSPTRSNHGLRGVVRRRSPSPLSEKISESDNDERENMFTRFWKTRMETNTIPIKVPSEPVDDDDDQVDDDNDVTSKISSKKSNTSSQRRSQCNEE